MNLLNHDIKMRLFNDNHIRNHSKLSHHMEDLVRRTNKNLSTGVYIPSRLDLHSDFSSIGSSTNRLVLDEISHYNLHGAPKYPQAAQSAFYKGVTSSNVTLN